LKFFGIAPICPPADAAYVQGDTVLKIIQQIQLKFGSASLFICRAGLFLAFWDARFHLQQPRKVRDRETRAVH
jgi:hypothetical protein